MIELIVPYKVDCKEREQNLQAFQKYYKEYTDITVTLIKDYNERYEVFNSCALKSKSKYIALTDVDAIISKDQIDKALFELENGADMVYPFDYILNVEKNGTIRDNWPKGYYFGIMVMFNREKFIEFGGENTDFIGYGWEDLERYYRALNFGLNMKRIEGCALHMQHPRYGFDNPHIDHNWNIMDKEKHKWLNRTR